MREPFAWFVWNETISGPHAWIDDSQPLPLSEPHALGWHA